MFPCVRHPICSGHKIQRWFECVRGCSTGSIVVTSPDLIPCKKWVGNTMGRGRRIWRCCCPVAYEPPPPPPTPPRSYSVHTMLGRRAKTCAAPSRRVAPAAAQARGGAARSASWQSQKREEATRKLRRAMATRRMMRWRRMKARSFLGAQGSTSRLPRPALRWGTGNVTQGLVTRSL